MRTSVIQLHVDGDVAAEQRLAEVQRAVRAEADRGAEFVVLPEMWLPGFFGFDSYPDFAESTDGPTATLLAQLAGQCQVYLCAGSLVERSADGLHNTTLLFGPDATLHAAYRKIHLYGYGSRERQQLVPGKQVVTCDVAGVRIGLSTCYDLRFPELYRAAVEDGAEAFVVVAAWPFPRVDAWRCLGRARAIENQAVVIGCNTSGTQDGRVFAGSSYGFDAWGTPLGELDDRPGVLPLDLDADRIRQTREDFPALRDRVF